MGRLAEGRQMAWSQEGGEENNGRGGSGRQRNGWNSYLLMLQA